MGTKLTLVDHQVEVHVLMLPLYKLTHYKVYNLKLDQRKKYRNVGRIKENSLQENIRIIITRYIIITQVPVAMDP